ncbi:MAG: DUF11 domain-containing protein [Clostridia bacterium]|nr:DUF11 domain-containing protein [Clostridia bacterium]
MAIFSNQATLTYSGISTSSNVAYGEILDALSVYKTSIEGTYAPNSIVTYVVTLRNTSNTPLNGITLTDDLGGYDYNGTTLYPLDYSADSVALFIDGVPQVAPTVTAGPPLEFSGINVPANADAVLVYQARVNSFANLNIGGSIVNTVTAAGTGVTTPLTASATIVPVSEAALTITKSITPTQVVDNERVTYTFVIQNTGTNEVVATDDAVISDIFDPVLTDLVVAYNGVTWTDGTQYNYDETTGLFVTNPGQITVPAASYIQDPVTGEYSSTPGTVTLIVTGTI